MYVLVVGPRSISKPSRGCFQLLSLVAIYASLDEPWRFCQPGCPSVDPITAPIAYTGVEVGGDSMSIIPTEKLATEDRRRYRWGVDW